jgi:hypothetical protein
MNHDDWPDDTIEKRRAMIRETIHPVDYKELKDLAERRFTLVTDPWFVRFNEFLDNHKQSGFHRAEAPGGAEIIYCRDAGQGVWFIPGTGMGIIQPKGLQILAEIVDAL